MNAGVCVWEREKQKEPLCLTLCTIEVLVALCVCVCVALQCSVEWRVEASSRIQSADSRQVNCDGLAAHLELKVLCLSCLSVCLSISTSLSTPSHSTLPQTELMTRRLQQRMSTHIHQSSSTQTSLPVFVLQLQVQTGSCTRFILYCLLSVFSSFAVLNHKYHCFAIVFAGDPLIWRSNSLRPCLFVIHKDDKISMHILEKQWWQ